MLDVILDELKKFGICHRDLNPGNILWSEQEGLLKLPQIQIPLLDIYFLKQTSKLILNSLVPISTTITISLLI
jgi:serine/threonine protein kinase